MLKCCQFVHRSSSSSLCYVFLHVVASHSQNDPHFEPVIKLENQVETATGEEGEDQLFKMCVWRRHTANFMAD